MTDYFISYTHADAKWAEWIAYVLEEEGFSTSIQAWDFRPGSNFVLEMQKAAASAERTVMVLSPDYLKSQFASPEWAAAFVQDPRGMGGKLVPVVVRDCTPQGLLTSIVQIRIFGMDEPQARQELLTGLRQTRVKPTSRPAFPGAMPAASHKTFPGTMAKSRPVVSSVLPSMKRDPTDLEKRRFVQAGFETIRETFRNNLDTASREDAHIEADFQLKNEMDFTAEIFLNGKSASRCRIWKGGMHSENNICYSEGHSCSDGSCNEIIALAGYGKELIFHATVAMGGFGYEKKFNTERMSAEQASEYLWSRFVHRLSM